MSKKENNTEPKFNEYQAYEELRMIIAMAIETQDFASLEPNIAIWENKYPLADFIDPDIIRKIKVILNKDYLSRLIGDYLASQVLHEKQKQLEAYNNLKKIIDTAKKKKDYATAKKEVAQWKQSLYDNGLSIYSFDKLYIKQIFKLLLLPSKELLKQQEASDSLKRLVNDSKEMESETLVKEISSWQNKYSLETFPIDLKDELNSITADVFKTIATKRSEEIALKEIEDYIASDKMDSPADEIPNILSKYDYAVFSDDVKRKIASLTSQAISLTELSLENRQSIEMSDEDIDVAVYIPPVQQEALLDLRSIFNKKSYDLESLFNWIYLNRKINFVPYAKEEIKGLFSMAGFPKPTSGQYSIPLLEKDISNLSNREINKIREQVVINYLGILYMDNSSLSDIAKDRISTIKEKQEVLSAVQETTIQEIIIPVEDNTDHTDHTDNSSVVNNVEESISSEVLDESPDEINILIEDILKDPLESIEIPLKRHGKLKDKIVDDFSTTITTESTIDESRKPSFDLSSDSSLSDINTNSINITDISDSTDTSDTTNNNDATIEEEKLDDSMVTPQGQETLEYINYSTSIYYIREIPIHRRRIQKNLANDYSYSMEKNNGL